MKDYILFYPNFYSAFLNSRLRNIKQNRCERELPNLIVRVKQDFNGSCSQRNW